MTLCECLIHRLWSTPFQTHLHSTLAWTVLSWVQLWIMLEEPEMMFSVRRRPLVLRMRGPYQKKHYGRFDLQMTKFEDFASPMAAESGLESRSTHLTRISSVSQMV